MKKEQTIKQINARVYHYWQALYMAFYSRLLYIDVAKRWRGIGGLYLLLLLAVVTIPVTIRLVLNYNQFINQQIIEPLKMVPPIELQQGTIIFTEPMPYYVKGKNGKVVAVIDTRLHGLSIDQADPDVMLLVTRDKFYYRAPSVNLFPQVSSKRQSHEPIVKTPPPHINKILNLEELLNSSGILKMKWMTAIFIYPLVIFFFFGLIISFFPVVAMLAQVFSFLIFRFKIKFFVAIRLLIVSATAQLLLLLLCLGFNILFLPLITICLILWMVYFSYAILAVKRDSQRLVRS